MACQRLHEIYLQCCDPRSVYVPKRCWVTLSWHAKPRGFFCLSASSIPEFPVFGKVSSLHTKKKVHDPELWKITRFLFLFFLFLFWPPCRQNDWIKMISKCCRHLCRKRAAAKMLLNWRKTSCLFNFWVCFWAKLSWTPEVNKPNPCAVYGTLSISGCAFVHAVNVTLFHFFARRFSKETKGCSFRGGWGGRLWKCVWLCLFAVCWIKAITWMRMV